MLTLDADKMSERIELVGAFWSKQKSEHAHYLIMAISIFDTDAQL
jgi:hypothetical protein